MDLMEETRLAMRVYAMRGLPQAPDRALFPRGPDLGPAGWFTRLAETDPAAAARLRDAIDQGSRNGPYAAMLHD